MKLALTTAIFSKMEKGVDRSPSREVALRLADALGLSDWEDRIKFLSAAGVVSGEDLKGFALIKIEDGEAEEDETEEEDQTSASSLPSIANPALALPDSLLDTAYERIEAIIESKHYSEEETERFVAGLIESAELLSKAIKPQHKSKRKVRL